MKLKLQRQTLFFNPHTKTVLFVRNKKKRNTVHQIGHYEMEKKWSAHQMISLMSLGLFSFLVAFSTFSIFTWFDSDFCYMTCWLAWLSISDPLFWGTTTIRLYIASKYFIFLWIPQRGSLRGHPWSLATTRYNCTLTLKNKAKYVLMPNLGGKNWRRHMARHH